MTLPMLDLEESSAASEDSKTTQDVRSASNSYVICVGVMKSVITLACKYQGK